MKLTNVSFKALQKRVQGGNLDTKELRGAWEAIYRMADRSLWGVGEILGHPVVFCDACGQPSYAAKTKSTYNGAYWICDADCIKKYGHCGECRTPILLSDFNNPTHVHDNVRQGFLHFPVEAPVAVFNADIMVEGKAKFFKTPEEIFLLKRRQLNARDPEKVFRNFGLEIEVEKLPGGPPDLLGRTRKVFGDFAIMKHDGSLSRRGKGGFEIVSMPATLAFHEGGIWTNFFRNLGSFFHEQPSTTGLHIHIGTNTLSPLIIDKMILFVNAEENREFIFAMANRNLLKPNPNGRLYAGVKTWKPSDMMKLKQHAPKCPWHVNNRLSRNYYKLVNGEIATDPFGNPIIASLSGEASNVRSRCQCAEGHYNIDHYEAVNLRTHRPTVELRMFKGIVNESFLYACLEFADSLPDFCAENKLENLHYKNYLDFLKGKTKRYHNLYRLLVNQCWIDPPKSKHEVNVPAYGIYA